MGTSTVYTVYNGDNVYADFNSSGTLTNRYLYGPAVDMIMARLGTSGTAWYLSDHQGSVRLLVDASSGSVLDSITYDSYGNPTEQPASGNITYTMDRFKYTGREYDTALAGAFAGERDFRLQYNRSRYYNPVTGAFVSVDPLGFDAGDSNLYRYVGNGPTNGMDPSGLRECDDRETDKTRPLRNVDKFLEDIVNNVIREKFSAATAEPTNQWPAATFVEEVYKALGTDEPGTGIHGFSEVTRIAVLLEKQLDAEGCRLHVLFVVQDRRGTSSGGC